MSKEKNNEILKILKNRDSEQKEKRVTVNIRKSHHEALKAVASARGYEIQEQLDLVLYQICEQIQNITVAELVDWYMEINPEKKQPK